MKAIVAGMRVIIAGSRKIIYEPAIWEAISEAGFYIQEVVSGCADGVDKAGERMAEKLGIPVKRFPADWKTYGKSAGHIRNRQMAEYADALIAIWDGKSRGTADMIEIMKAMKKTVHVKVL